MDVTPLLSAGIPAAFSLAAAFYAGSRASKVQKAGVEADRLRDLEQRLSEKKAEMYAPMIRALSLMLMSDEFRATLPDDERADKQLDSITSKFMAEAITYASDDALRAFSRFRLAGTASPPVPIIMRLVADFLIEVRKDVAGEATTAGALELLGARINDLFTEPELLAAVSEDLPTLAVRFGWTPPWEGHGTALD
jgi:hypothetical protein